MAAPTTQPFERSANATALTWTPVSTDQVSPPSSDRRICRLPTAQAIGTAPVGAGDGGVGEEGGVGVGEIDIPGEMGAVGMGASCVPPLPHAENAVSASNVRAFARVMPTPCAFAGSPPGRTTSGIAPILQRPWTEFPRKRLVSCPATDDDQRLPQLPLRIPRKSWSCTRRVGIVSAGAAVTMRDDSARPSPVSRVATGRMMRRGTRSPVEARRVPRRLSQRRPTSRLSPTSWEK